MSELEVKSGERGRQAVERAFLIADVRGYTRFTRERGDAEAARLAGAFAGLARDSVAARGGSVIELRGDEALAVFASPAQAIRAAIDLVAVCAEETERAPDLPLLVGVGIEAGPAVPLEGGYRGAAINMAARLCSQAAAGQVLVSADLAHGAGEVRGIDFAPHGAVELKGFETPVEVVSASARPRPRPPAAPAPESEPLPLELERETPIVGRDAELSWLRGCWRQARRGDGRVLVVSGPSGSGRTRLAAELAAAVTGQSGHVEYGGSGGTALALAEAHLRSAAGAAHPTLLVLDDLDVLGEEFAASIGERRVEIEQRPVLILCLVPDPDASPAVAALVESADAAGDGHRRLAPLGADAVREIVELYAGDAADEVSVESLERASQGIPGRVHELMSEWAEREAGRRLAAAAAWLSAERIDRNADLKFANNVIALKLARLYSADGPVEATPAACPYKGLASFEDEDARFFFGREQLIGELAARSVGVGLLAVVGASGSGKSSAIAAGLVPSLRAGLLPGSDRWQIAAMRPAERPADALVEALRSVRPGRLVLVVDQFEEVFSPELDEAERSAFVERLVTLAAEPDSCVVVLGLRADFYGHCAAYPELARLVAANQVLVGPMRDPELRRAIELPARRVGVRVDSALVDRLVSEVVDQPGGLPLLSTALVELWGLRGAGWLRRDAYEQAGGVHGAVARLAESSYQQLDEHQRDLARALFMRLVATGEEGLLVRRTINRAELGMEPPSDMTEVVARLTDDRLLTVTDDTVEVAHEALLREWPRLADWLREDAQSRELREHLMAAARRWEGSGRDTGELYRGARLAMTLDWAAGRELELNDTERAFLTEGRAEAAREAERQRRSNRRLRVLLAGLSVVLVCAVAAGVIAFVQRSSAQHEATVALGRQLGAEAVSEPRIDRAMLLARQSLNLDRSSNTESTLLATLLRSPALIGTFTVPIVARPLTVAVAPDGRTMAVQTNEGEDRMFNIRSRRQTGVVKQGGLPPTYMPHSDQFFTSAAGPGQLLRVDSTGRVLQRYQWGTLWETTLSGPIEPITVSHDGRYVFLLWSAVNPDGGDGVAYLQRWSVATGGRPRIVAMDERGAIAATATGGGRLLIATDDAVTTWNATTLRRVGRVTFQQSPGLVVGAISPNGHTFAYGEQDGTVHFVDVADGRTWSGTAAHSADVQNMAFSPDSRLAVSTGDDGLVIVWDAATGRPLERLVGHAGRVEGAAFSPDGRTLYTASLDGTVLQWDIGGARRFGDPFPAGQTALTGGAQSGSAQLAPATALSPDGHTLAIRSGNSGVRLISTRTLSRTGSFSTGAGTVVGALAWAGRRVATGQADGTVTVWSSSGTRVASLRGLHHMVRGVATAEGGRLVAAVDGTTTNFTEENGRLAIWNRGRLVGGAAINLHTFGNAVAFSPDGSLLAVATDATDRPSVLIVDPKSGRVLRSMRPLTGAISLAFSPDGTLASGSWEGIVNLWDPETGARIGHASLAAAAPIASIAFDPTGRRYAIAGGSSGLARLWDTSTEQQIGSDFPGGQGQWGTVALTPDGRYLLVVYGDGTAYRWPISVGAWEQHACAVAGHNMTHEEWQRYVANRPYVRTCPQYPPGA